MNKKIGIAIALVIMIVVVVVLYVSFLSEPDEEGNGNFTLTLEPTQATMEVGKSRNFTITVISTGYEGNITDSGPTYSWTGEEPPLFITGEFLPLSDVLGARFLQANGSLTLTLRVTWSLYYGESLNEPANVILNTGAYGNWKQPDKFLVSSNSISITVTPTSG